MKFYIWTYEYSLSSGGNIALHQLADDLRQHGHSVETGMSGNSDSIAIYPEVVVGNPFGASKVVRWILNTPGVVGGDGIYGEDDLIALWTKGYSIPNGRIADCMLSNIRDLSHFVNRGPYRIGECHLIRKGHYKQLDQHSEFSLCIDDYAAQGGDSYLIDMLNWHERLISYDHATAISTLAVLCGCESIVIPDGIRTVEQAVEDHDLAMSGIAWGFNDLDRARATRDDMPKAISMHRDKCRNQLCDFIDLCEKKWK